MKFNQGLFHQSCLHCDQILAEHKAPNSDGQILCIVIMCQFTVKEQPSEDFPVGNDFIRIFDEIRFRRPVKFRTDFCSMVNVKQVEFAAERLGRKLSKMSAHILTSNWCFSHKEATSRKREHALVHVTSFESAT